MRNLKKILALVLAMVMAFSVMATANAALTDLDSVDASYDEAVEVLTGMGVFEGRTAADGSTYFAPKGTITRQEVAAILYRIDTGRVGDEAAMFVEAADFADVKATDWAAGYIGYCANGGLVQGYAGKFNPTAEIDGYQVLAMILRAIGYGKNGEFTGSEWQKNVAAYAQELGILKGLNKDVVLSQPATREVVAEILFKAIAYVKQVEYTPAFNYQPTLITGKTQTIGEEVFGLTRYPAKGTTNIDVWGRPGYYWYCDDDSTVGFSSKDTVYATIEEDYLKAYTVATTECDIASDLGIKTTDTFVTYTNGVGNAGSLTINATDTVTKVGAQGQLVEFYADEVVIIDTYLAEVTDVVAATFDAAGHLKTSSELHLDVYTSVNNNVGVAEHVVLFGGSTNYTYADGQMLLVNAVDAANGNIATKVASYSTTVCNTNRTPSTLKILGAAESLVGAQTILWWNVEQHTVDGTTYNDAVRFYLDEAGTDIGAHAWYFDQYGNLIGVTDVATQYTYGVISNLWWAGDASTGTGVAKATLTYMDGTTATVNLARVDTDGVTGTNTASEFVPAYSATVGNVMDGDSTNGKLYVSTNAYTNVTSTANGRHGIIGGHMFQFVTLADGSVVAYKVQAEITDATISKGVSLIAADTADSDGIGTGTPIYTNSETVYLVRTGAAATGYTWTSVTDYNMIGNYTGATVDSVNTDADIYAEYVYLYGTSNDNTSAFVMATGNNYGAHLRTTANGISYYEFTYGLNMDGTTSTLKIYNGDYNNDTVADYTDVITKMSNGVGKLFKITYLNGYAVDATEVGTTAVTSGIYDALYLGNDVKANANALQDGPDNSITKVYNVTASTVVIGGTLADLATAGKSVYVVYATANSNDALYIYITNFAKNTVADAAAVLNAVALVNGGHDYGTITLAENATNADAQAAVLAAVNAKLAAAGITGVTATLNAGYLPTASAGLQWFQVDLADALNGTASVGSNTVTIALGTSEATIKATINSTITANASGLTSTGSFEACAAAVKAQIDAGYSVTSTVTVSSSTGKWESGAQMTVSYSFLYNGATISGSSTFTMA